MLYIKILSGDTVVGAEAIKTPAYVKHQARNNIIVRCSEPQAQGILSLDSSTVYQLEGCEQLPGVELTAVKITMAEYEELISNQTPTDPEDEDPVIPDGGSESDILTRAELTEKVLALEDELTAAKILLGVE